ncbi:MAG: alpha/beta fold hydrolase [Flavobacteriaceae bacterium]|nr:alpha/beta fold hydrolase [Bacteroidia bacterium]MBT8287726.1 alpha/beta fold hydrolase [Bacteroidia bacterium]NNF73917.1 alpha/beta fold hydrolase [Flavobacteriaceae bacterium]NNK71857.1 alpha/beta fold hydrolase [Flavobacteriaceae bacterium]
MAAIYFKEQNLHFQDIGFGQPIVFLHGFLEDKSIWKSMINGLSNEYKCVSIDLPGHGKSGSFNEIHTMEEMAQAVKAVIDYLEIDRVILAGHSMGGYVALAFAELFPRKVLALSLINSTPKADNAEKQLNRDRAVEAVIKDKQNFIRMSIPQLFAAETREMFQKEINKLKNKAALMDVEGITAALKGMKIRIDRTAVMVNGSYPSQIIIGAKDNLVPISSLDDLRKNREIEIIEIGGGHMSYIESVEELSYYFMRFIEKV